ncbi:hypothetical protein GCM10020254_50470 [Streptomyces goshikiensis]
MSQDPSTVTCSSGSGRGTLISVLDLVLAGTFSVPPGAAGSLPLGSPLPPWPSVAVVLVVPSSPETYQMPPPTMRTMASSAAPTIISWVRLSPPPPPPPGPAGARGVATVTGMPGAPGAPGGLNCPGAPGCCG